MQEQNITAGEPKRSTFKVVGGTDSGISISYENDPETNLSEAQMSDMTRNELQAHLKASKSEVESVASSMRTEMANFRTSYTESFKDISISLNNISAKSDATEKRLTQAQWIISLVISVCAVMLSIVIFFSNKSANKPAPPQQPNVVVNTIPQTSTPPAITPEK
ncbi:hypothetical protein [Rahnella sp. PCH160]|uniref:hypothetical protein n=1 Tax=Rahnella sp. PCH160 TaxID=3447928 RepID=UPI0039FC3139